jgi:AraC-like DNA-binding protein
MLFREKLPIEDHMDGSIYRWQGPHPKFSPHTHEELEMNLVTKGEGTYFIEGHKYKLKPFHQLWLFRDQLHILSDSSSDFEMWVVVFKKGMVEDACRSPHTATLHRSRPKGEFLKQLPLSEGTELSQLCHQIGQSDKRDLFNASLRYLLIKSWETFEKAGKFAKAEDLHPAVFKAAMLLKEESFEGNLAALCHKAGLSPSHLSRLFHLQTGQTLTDYRNQQGIERFQKIISENSQKSILEAALEAGFGSYAQFYRVFRKKFQFSPKQYKKETP